MCFHTSKTFCLSSLVIYEEGGGESSASNQQHNNIYISVFYFKPGDVQKISGAVREHQNINYIIIDSENICGKTWSTSEASS